MIFFSWSALRCSGVTKIEGGKAARAGPANLMQDAERELHCTVVYCAGLCGVGVVGGPSRDFVVMAWLGTSLFLGGRSVVALSAPPWSFFVASPSALLIGPRVSAQ